MAGFGLFFGWGATRAGREAAADKVLGEALAYWNELKAAGEIEGVDVVILGAHGGDLSGFALLRGDREKLARLRMTPEFARLVVRVEMVADDVGVVEAYINEGVAYLMGIWREAIAGLA